MRLPLALAGLAASALIALPTPARATETWVRVGGVYTGKEARHPDGAAPRGPSWLVLRDGKLKAILADRPSVEPPLGARVLDRRDLVAAPGLVLTALAVGADGARDDETASARFRAIDGFDPYAPRRRLLAQGITTAFLHPGRGRLMTGEGAVVKLAGKTDRRVLRARAELCVELGDQAIGPPADVEIPFPSSSDVPIVPGKRQRPSGRLGLVAELAAQIRAARAYREARQRLPAAERPAHDPDLETLDEALFAGRLRIDARRARDLRRLVQAAAELDLNPVISGATEAYAAVAQLAAAGAPVIYEVPLDLRGRAVDLGENPDRLRPRADTPRRLVDAGVPVALAPVSGSEEDLRLLAALTVRGGLTPADALAGITSRAARALGVEDRLGALTPGLDADFVLLSGPPLATSSEVLETWIEGEPVYVAHRTDALVVRAGTVHTLAGPALTPGELLIVDGSIAAVGSSVPHPRGARVLDAGPNGVITPGFIDAFGHLGLEGQGGAIRATAELALGLEGTGPSFDRVARAGVTTVVVGPRAMDRAGSPMVALKTVATRPRSEDLFGGVILAERAGVAFDLRTADPLGVEKALARRLKAVKGDAAKWAKYRKELAKWETEHAKKQAEERAALRKERAQRRWDAGEAEGAEEPKPAEEQDAEAPKKEGGETTVEKVEEKGDPISGTWAFTLAGGPFPPRSGELLLRLETDKRSVSGLARQADGAAGGEFTVSGSFEGTHLSLTLEIETPFGAPQLEAEMEEDDRLRGTVRLGPITLTFEANRTEKEAPTIKLQLKRKRSKDGRPEPPTVNPALEGLRLALEGRATVLLRIKNARAAAAAVTLLGREGIRTVVVGFGDADLAAEAVEAAGGGFVLRPELVIQRRGQPVDLAVELEGRVPLAFASEAEDGAAELPLRAVAAVARGLSAGQALRALTYDAARLLGLDDRVGSLSVGKDGDLLVWDGPPFEATSRLRHVVVGGRPVEEEAE